MQLHSYVARILIITVTIYGDFASLRKITFQDKKTALHYAASKGYNVSIVKSLIKSGADINAADKVCSWIVKESCNNNDM